ncbi:hypothetical protein CRUP_037933, partial [Coryphaenoides rupestris]
MADEDDPRDMRRGVSVRRLKVFLTMTTGRLPLLPPLLLLLLLEGHLALETAKPGTPVTDEPEYDECKDEDHPELCNKNAECITTVDSFYCKCMDGYNTTQGNKFRPEDGVDCIGVGGVRVMCPAHARCENTAPGYGCICEEGFTAPWDVCVLDQTLCGNGTCHQGEGGHVCTCQAGFSNYANERLRCTELRCELFQDAISRPEDSPDVQSVLTLLEHSCRALSKNETPTDKINGEDFLKSLLSAIDRLLTSGAVDDNRKVSTLLDVVETALGLISPFMRQFKTHVSTAHTGFTTVSLLTYTTLENSNTSSIAADLRPRQINSKVVTVKVSNLETNDLQEHVELTFRHLEEVANRTDCVYWDSLSGNWSTEGCSVVRWDANQTTCSCNHLSTFAILMALHEIE